MLIHGLDTTSGELVPIKVTADGTPVSAATGDMGTATPESTAALRDSRVTELEMQLEYYTGVWSSPTAGQTALLAKMTTNIADLKTAWGL